MNLQRIISYDPALVTTINEKKYPWNTPEFKRFIEGVSIPDGNSPPMDVGLYKAPETALPIEPFYVVALNVAGYNKIGFKINLIYNTLVISYENRFDYPFSETEGANMILDEIFDDDFTQKIIFGSPIRVDFSKIENGILTIVVKFHDPKSETRVKIN